MEKAKVIAIDMGASSGRLVEVILEDNKLVLSEKYRFPNAGIRIHDRIYTDILYIFHNIIKGLQICAKEGEGYKAVGIDTWGVDFGFLDNEEELLTNPYHYRDSQSSHKLSIFEKQFGNRGLFYETGSQNMWYNTVYQLMGIKLRKKDAFQKAKTFLMIPDILGYFLTGECNLEYTSVSTTQMYDIKNKRWSERILSTLGLDASIFPKVLNTGEIKGNISEHIRGLTGLMEDDIKLIATAQHDSASAAYAVPADEEQYLFINSGTWSIIGTVLDEPVITDEVFEHGFSNEGAAFGKTKLVKSVMGMWQVQEIRKYWEKQGLNIDYGYLISEARKSAPFSGFIDADDEGFVSPSDMEDAIRQYLSKTGQDALKNQGEYYRVIMESLAFKYKQAITDLERICRQEYKSIYLLGGAVQDQDFCQYIANATGKEVVAGPVEATAIGNAMIQLQALGKINENQVADVIKASFPVQKYQPENVEMWNANYERYIEFTRKICQ